MVRIATDKFTRVLKNTRIKNRKNLCRYFTLIYDKDYASSMAGAKCDGNSNDKS